jgi:hypothetical protein
MNQLKSLKIRKVEATLLGEAGDYLLQVVNFEFMNSFEKNFNHEIKENIKELQEVGKLWCDPTPQIAITFADKDGKGLITNRFNCCGYVYSDDPEVTDEMIDREDIMPIGKYVCQQSDDGWKRIESSEKTESALRMLFSFLNKLGFTNEKMDVETALETAVKDKYLIVGTVAEDDYEGKTRHIIEKFSTPKLEDTENADDVDEKDLK